MTDKPFYEKLGALLKELHATININDFSFALISQVEEMQAELVVRKKLLDREIADRAMLMPNVNYRVLEERVCADLVSRCGMALYDGVSANSRQYKNVCCGVDGRTRLHYDPLDKYLHLLEIDFGKK